MTLLNGLVTNVLAVEWILLKMRTRVLIVVALSVGGGITPKIVLHLQKMDIFAYLNKRCLNLTDSCNIPEGVTVIRSLDQSLNDKISI
jgi:hypothetical protein